MKVFIRIDDAYADVEIDDALLIILAPNSDDQARKAAFVAQEMTPYIEAILMKLAKGREAA